MTVSIARRVRPYVAMRTDGGLAGPNILERAVTVAELKRALHSMSPAAQPAALDSGEAESRGSDIVVVGAQANVGTSTLAVVLAEALGQCTPETSVRLVDLADRRYSGLLCAPDRELGEEASGWRLARRQNITVESPAGDLMLEASPRPRYVADSHAVIDTGLPVEGLAAHGGWLRELLGGNRVALVCAASVPGVRRAETALAAIAGEPCVVAVGVGRWPSPVLASAGPRLRAAHSSGRTFVVPADKRLAVEGVDDQPMPRPVLAAAAHVLDALTRDASAPRFDHTRRLRWS